MTMLKIVDYGCDICGATITVSGDGCGHVSPIYCCGVLVSIKDIRQADNTAPEAKSRKSAKKPVPAAKKKSRPFKKTVAKKTTKPRPR